MNNSNNMYDYNQSNYNNQFTPINGKVKRRGGCLFALLKFFLVILVLIAIIIGVFVYLGYRKEQKEIEEFEKEIIVEDYSEYIEEKIKDMQNEASDIEGMTKYDKIDKGLNPEDGSDSDMDGLSDKDEIEVYGSDPLSPSTSNDGIPDGYKVLHNLDVLKKYDGNEIGFNTYSNIQIKDKNSENAIASITEVDGYKVQGILADKVYSIINYNGEVELDFSEYISKDSNYVIFKKNDEMGSEYEVLKDKNGVVSVDTKGYDCVVGIVKLNSDIMFNDAFLASDYVNESDFLKGNDAIVVIFPLTIFTRQLEMTIFEKSLLGIEKDKSEALSKWLTDVTGYSKDGYSINVKHRYVNAIQFNMISKVFNYIMSGKYTAELLSSNGVNVTNEDISTFQKVLSLFIMAFDVKSGEWLNAFVGTDSIMPEDNVKAEKVSKYVSGFDVSKDALPFPNLSTYASKGGNCAGFAHITAQLFNDNLYDETAESVFDGKTYSYDITDMNYFSTFFDMYLYDYKNYSYWKDTYSNMSELSRNSYSEEDRNFLDFLGYKWAEANDINKRVLFYNNELPWSDFEKVISYFEDNNKILSLGMSSGGSGHAINAYGVEQDEDNPNIWYLLIYDNNFPNNQYKGYSIDNRVKIVHKHPLFGEDYFEFDYRPLSDKAPNYRYTSYFNASWKAKIVTAFQAHMFVMYDDNLNFIIGEDVDK